MLDDIRDAIGPTRIEPSEEALVRLPGGGRLLVDSSAGAWIVRSDGSKRLLGPYDDATWSPHGLYVAATQERELAALTPDGEVRWTLARNGPVSSPRWAGSRVDTRIAYLDGRSLRIVAGDGTGDRLLDRPVTAHAWSPAAGSHTLAYLKPGGRLQVRDVDTGRTLWRTRVPGARTITWSPGATLAVVSRQGIDTFDHDGRRIGSLGLPNVTAAAFPPDGRRLAVIRTLRDGRSETVLLTREPLACTPHPRRRRRLRRAGLVARRAAAPRRLAVRRPVAVPPRPRASEAESRLRHRGPIRTGGRASG